MSKTQFLTLEDRFRMLPPDTNPFTVESIAEELGKTPEQAKRMLKSYIGQSEKALQNIEGNHVKDAELFDLKAKKLEEIGRHVILPESWKRNTKYVKASWGLYYHHAWKIDKLKQRRQDSTRAATLRFLILRSLAELGYLASNQKKALGLELPSTNQNIEA